MSDNRRSRGDELASEGKTRDTRLPRSRQERGTARPFYCRTCGRSKTGVVIPTGWYRLQRKLGVGAPGEPELLRLGLYCTAACLAGQLPRIAAVEEDLRGAIDAAVAEENRLA